MMKITFDHPINDPVLLYIDIETFGPDGEIDILREIVPESHSIPSHPGGLSLAVGQISVVTIAMDDGSPRIFEYREMSEDTRRDLLRFLLNGNHTLVGHNIGFDLAFLLKEAERLGVRTDPIGPGVLDTMHIARLLLAQSKTVTGPDGATVERRDSLKWCANHFLGVVIDKFGQREDWGGVITAGMQDYARQDVTILRELLDGPFHRLTDELIDVALFEGKAIWNVAKMAARGFPVDADGLWSLTEALAQRWSAERIKLQELTGLKSFHATKFGKFLSDEGVKLP